MFITLAETKHLKQNIMRRYSEVIRRELVAEFQSAQSFNDGGLRFCVRVERNTYEDGSVKEITHYSKEDSRRYATFGQKYVSYTSGRGFKSAIARAEKSQDWN